MGLGFWSVRPWRRGGNIKIVFRGFLHTALSSFPSPSVCCPGRRESSEGLIDFVGACSGLVDVIGWLVELVLSVG